jgi:glyoxylase-like metal-dependent hydrolase (beta-lactamase superfamily II)
MGDARHGRGSDALGPISQASEWRVGELEITLIHTPGHTPGSQCLLG